MSEWDAKPDTTADSNLDCFVRVLLMTVVVGVPLLVLGPLTYDPYSLPKLALLIGGLGTAAGIVAARSFMGRPPRHIHRLGVPAVALVAPLALSWVASPHRGWTWLGSYSRYTGLLPYLAVAILGILLVEAFWGRPNPLAWALSISGGVAGTYAFVQALGLDPLWGPGLGGGSEYPPSTIGHFNFLGGFLALSLPLSIYLWVNAANRVPRIIAIWATAATIVGLLLANSQGGWAAALAGTAVVAGTFLQSRWKGARAAGIATAAAIVVIVVGAVAASLVFRDVDILGGTVRERGRLWVTALEMGADSPVVGHGPSAYALEGVRYRSLASVVAEKDAKADDPHSVPLSFWANSGALGVVGFIVFFVWLVALAKRITSGDHRSAAFFAAVVAYLVQSSVSIDLLPLRTGLWTALAGMTISIGAAAPGIPASESETSPRPKASSKPRVAISAVAGVVLVAISLWYAGNLVLADSRVERGRQLFEKGDLSAAKAEFNRATEFRFEPRYLNLFGEHLGLAALNLGEAGEPLITEMRRVYSYLEDFPETYGILAQARTLHYWGHFAPSADREALHLLQRARSLDPENPEIDIRISEVMIELGEAARAQELLEGWVPSLRGVLPSFWGALSTARLATGDVIGAAEALDEGIRLGPSNCRVRIAQALIDAYRNPQREPDANQSFTIALACGQGDYLFFSGLLSQITGH